MGFSYGYFRGFVANCTIDGGDGAINPKTLLILYWNAQCPLFLVSPSPNHSIIPVKCVTCSLIHVHEHDPIVPPTIVYYNVDFPVFIFRCTFNFFLQIFRRRCVCTEPSEGLCSTKNTAKYCRRGLTLYNNIRFWY